VTLPREREAERKEGLLGSKEKKKKGKAGYRINIQDARYPSLHVCS
jgi:hypothetical protein